MIPSPSGLPPERLTLDKGPSSSISYDVSHVKREVLLEIPLFSVLSSADLVTLFLILLSLLFAILNPCSTKNPRLSKGLTGFRL